MKRWLWVLLWFLLMPRADADAAPLPRVADYQCNQGKKISAAYVQYNQNINFVVLKYQGVEYALLPALSASGARYANLYGGALSMLGLEWWEHQGIATLSAFKNRDQDTQTLISGCRAVAR